MRRVVLIGVPWLLFALGTAAGAVPSQVDPDTGTDSTTVTTLDPTTETTIVEPPIDGIPVDPGSPILEIPVITRDEVIAAGSLGASSALEIRRRIGTIAAERILAAGEIRDAEREDLEAYYEGYLQEIAKLQESGRYLDQIQFSYRELVDGLIEARRAYAKSLLYSYLQQEQISLDGDLDTRDGMDSAATDVYLDFVLTKKSQQMLESQQLLDEADPDILRVADEHGEARTDLDDLRSVRVVAEQKFAEANLMVDDANELAYEWQFPVAGNEYKFVDSFLAPRYVRNVYDHPHQGADIMAPYGTPLVAVERGILFKKGVGRLGGNKIWVLGESGTAYYYAHLAGFAENAANGVLVEPGVVIGFVGDTGNAVGTPPHVHFEIHPDAGRAVNPTSLLRYAQERDGNR